MTLNDYRQRYADLYNRRQTFRNQLKYYAKRTKKEFYRLFYQQQEIDKQWFVSNLDYILRHKQHIQDSELGNIVIDFLLLYYESGKDKNGLSTSPKRYKIYLKDLLDLWERGFIYKNYPIISYRFIYHYDFEKIIIEYVKNGQIERVEHNKENGKNPLELPEVIISRINSINAHHKYDDRQQYKRIDLIRDALKHQQNTPEKQFIKPEITMTIQEYRQRYADLYNKVNQAQQELDHEIVATEKEFDKLYQRQQEVDKRWFVANLDFFLKHKKHFTSDFGLSQIIVDFLTLYQFSSKYGGSSYGCKITIKDLLNLWDEGFNYEGYPIICYEKYIHEGVKIRISYVKNGRIEVASTDYQRGKNPLELPKELMEKVQKANLAFKHQYQNWQTYKTIDVVRNVLDKKEKADA